MYVFNNPNTPTIVQEGALLSRSSVLAIIEELERLQTVLETPLKQELETARSASRAEGAAEATAAVARAAAATKPPKPPKSSKEWEKEKKAAVNKARAEATVKAQAEAKNNLETAVKKASEDAVHSTIQSILDLLYFSSLLDPYAPYSAERAACLYYAHQTQSSLTQDDINALCYVGHLITMKSYYSPESHKDALATCKDIALRIISNPEAHVHPTVQQGITGKSLKQIVEAIKALDFFTMAPGQQPAAVPVGGSAIVMGHAQQAQQQSYVPSSYTGVNDKMQAAMPAVPGLFQNPQQQGGEQQQRQSVPATPALAVPTAAAPFPAATFVQKQDIRIPTRVPTPQAAPEVAIVKTKQQENLMNTFFGGASGAAEQHPQQQQQQQQQQHKEHEQKQSSGSLFFDNDFQLGTEGVSSEVDSDTKITMNEKLKSNTAPLFAPTSTALPAPSLHVLPVQMSGAAKKRRNHSSRGSSQSRGSGAGPVLTEADGPVGGPAAGAGTIKAFGGAIKGRKGGNAKKQAVQQSKLAVQQQQTQQHPPQLQFQQQQEEQNPAGTAPSESEGAATSAEARRPNRPNSKNGYYRRKPRVQQSQAQPQQA